MQPNTPPSETEDDILDQYALQSKSAAPANQLIYYASGFAVACLPIYLYVTIFNMAIVEYGPVFIILSGVAGLLLSWSYHNVSESVRLRLMGKLQDSPAPPAKSKLDRKKLKEEQLEEKINITNQEALSFALIYNNLFYLTSVIFLAFFFLKSLPSLYNYVLSIGVSGAIVMLSSTSKNE